MSTGNLKERNIAMNRYVTVREENLSEYRGFLEEGSHEL